MRTSAILLYVEAVRGRTQIHVGGARRGARQARRGDQVRPLRGRRQGGGDAYRSTGGFRRGLRRSVPARGPLRVFDLAELFDAAEALDQVKSLPGQRLAILTNGGGLGVLAVDQLERLAARLLNSSATRARLDASMPPTWSQANPVEFGDADAAVCSARHSRSCSKILPTTPFWQCTRTAVGSPVEIATALGAP